MKAKFTQGEWTVKMPVGGICKESAENISIRCNGIHVATVHTGVWQYRPSAEAIANARLIASSPELLTFAEEMVSYLELKLQGFRQDYPENHCIVQTAVRYLEQGKTTLAKAKGQA